MAKPCHWRRESNLTFESSKATYLPMKVIIRKIGVLTVLASLAISGYAQERKWSYGVTPEFNTNSIRGKDLRDSFSNKPGFGASLYLERHFSQWSAGAGLAYSQNRVYHEGQELTRVYDNAELRLSFIKPFKGESKTSLRLGLTPSYTIDGTTLTLDGSKSSGVARKDLPLEFQMDLGVYAGFDFHVSDAVNLQVGYTEFIRSVQKDEDIKGRGDAFRFGLQIRLNDLRKERPEPIWIYDEIQKVKKGGVVFVLPVKATMNEDNEEAREILSNVATMVDSHFRFTQHFFVADTCLGTFLNNPGMCLSDKDLNPINVFYFPEEYYVVRIGEGVLNEFEDIRRGVFMYRSDMNIIPEPFPSYIPLGSFSGEMTNDAVVRSLVIQFNNALQSLENQRIARLKGVEY